MTLLIYSIITISLILVTWYITKSISSVNINKLETAKEIYLKDLENKKLEIERINNHSLNLTSKIATLESDKDHLIERMKEKKLELVEIKEKMTHEFKNLAQDILDEKTKKFTDQNKLNIESLLKPFGERIKDFQKQVEQTNKEDIYRTTALKTEIQKLNELNLQVTKEAEALTKAIKGDSKTQGNWGEFILVKILEKSGLRPNMEFFIQESFVTEDGKRYRPDVIIKLPDNKNIVIDAKVSLTDYERYVNIEDSKLKEMYLKKHLLSIRTHIKTLSQKNYHLEYNLPSLDFVLMFLPIEPAFTIAIQKDPTIFTDAYNKNIVLVSPTTLIVTLKTINSIWKTEYQNKNVLEIAKQGGSLYDKFVGFIEDFKTIKDRISAVEKSYISAGKKLYEGRNNLVHQADKLRILGAKTTKSINPTIVNVATEEASK